MQIIDSSRNGALRAGRLGLVLSLMGICGWAHAACTDGNWAPRADTPHGPAPSTSLPALAQQVAFYPVDDFGGHSIVGLWKIEMLAKNLGGNVNPMPDGALVDFGMQAWHSDGTELLNSGSRNPADGDFCQGVWERIGDSMYALNHIALGWTSGAYTGPAHIRARVQVTGGNHYHGVFKLTQYLATMVPGHEFDETTTLVTITGTITGTRVTAD